MPAVLQRDRRDLPHGVGDVRLVFGERHGRLRLPPLESRVEEHLAVGARHAKGVVQPQRTEESIPAGVSGDLHGVHGAHAVVAH